MTGVSWLLSGAAGGLCVRLSSGKTCGDSVAVPECERKTNMAPEQEALYALPALSSLYERARWGRGLGLGLLAVSVVECLGCVMTFFLALGHHPWGIKGSSSARASGKAR